MLHPPEGKGPFSPQSSPPTQAAPCGIGHGTRGPGSRSNSRHHRPGWRHHVDGEEPLLTWPWGFTVRHSLEDLRAQLRRVPGTVEAKPSVDQHAVSTTFDEDQDAPHGGRSCAPMNAHRSQARMHLISVGSFQTSRDLRTSSCGIRLAQDDLVLLEK